MATPGDPRTPGAPPPGAPPPEGPPPGGPPPGGSAAAADRIEAAAREKLSPYLRILRRMLRSVRALAQAHVIVFRTEAERELARVAMGAGLVFGAALLLLCSALLLGAATVALVQRVTALPWLESIGIALLLTLLVAALLGLLGWLRLRKPLMPESRKLLADTLDGLTKG